MKIRNGFVSNSSSSSFVILINESEKCEHCGRSDPNILDLINNSCDDNGIEAIGKQEVLEYLKENDWIDMDSSNIELIKLVDENKQIVAIVDISYHYKILNELINNSKNIQILWKGN